MKSERITVLTTPEFKAFLASEALQEGVSVSELVRRRCEYSCAENEELLKSLTLELACSVDLAKSALTDGLQALEQTLAEMTRGQESMACDH